MRKLIPAATAIALTAVFPTAALAAGGGGGGTGADLQISGSASTGSPNPGTAYSYVFQVKNSGPLGVTDAIFTDTLPVGAAYRAAGLVAANTQYTCTTGTDASGAATVTCDLAVLPSGSSATIEVDATAPTTSGTFGDTANIGSNVADPKLSNNSVTVNIQVKVATCNLGGSPLYGLVMLKDITPGTQATSDFELQVSGVNYWVFDNNFDTTRPLTQYINLNCKAVTSNLVQVGNFVNVVGTVNGTYTTPDGVTMPRLDASLIQIQTFADLVV
ncbi:MAG TPA: hypothetical protein VFH58_00255 [Acidimicrobiales bacterium]|nr:hypothetical protein [Acidimicrobiales bacterium]